jgi:methyl-accepting chemotaxis protein
VVASEVKQLAGEASGITVRISDLISAIHDGAGNAETRLAEIAHAVASLDGADSAIQAAIGEQRRTASTIDDHARATASGADDIARRIAAVAEAVRSAEDLSEQVRASSAELLSSAQLLTGATGTFVTTLRSA